MANRLTREVQQLKETDPGHRFEAGYERTKVDNRVVRLGLVTLGFALMAAAAVTFWLPGPNFILVFAGLALVGGQSRHVARLMDRREVAARRWNRERWDPYPHKTAAMVVAAILLAAAVVLIAWLAYGQGWLPGWLTDLVGSG